MGSEKSTNRCRECRFFSKEEDPAEPEAMAYAAGIDFGKKIAERQIERLQEEANRLRLNMKRVRKATKGYASMVRVVNAAGLLGVGDWIANVVVEVRDLASVAARREETEREARRGE